MCVEYRFVELYKDTTGHIKCVSLEDFTARLNKLEIH